MTAVNEPLRPEDPLTRLKGIGPKSAQSLADEGVRSILVNSAVASSTGGFGQRIRERYGRYLGDDLSVERDQTIRQPGLFD